MKKCRRSDTGYIWGDRAIYFYWPRHIIYFCVTIYFYWPRHIIFIDGAILNFFGVAYILIIMEKCRRSYTGYIWGDRAILFLLAAPYYLFWRNFIFLSFFELYLFCPSTKHLSKFLWRKLEIYCWPKVLVSCCMFNDISFLQNLQFY